MHATHKANVCGVCTQMSCNLATAVHTRSLWSILHRALHADCAVPTSHPGRRLPAARGTAPQWAAVNGVVKVYQIIHDLDLLLHCSAFISLTCCLPCMNLNKAAFEPATA